MNNNFWKVFACTGIIMVLLFIGFFAMLYAAFAGGIRFYVPVVIAVTVALSIFTVIFIFRLLKPKVRWIAFISFILLTGIAIAGYELRNSYINSLATVDEKEVDLEQYVPFAKDTKAVRLDEESTLKLVDDLPRLDGATALYPLYSAFVQAVYPEKDYHFKAESEVACTKTIKAYERLISGEVDIIFCARPSAKQIEEAKKQGVEFKLTPIAYEAFVFFVNSKNPVSNLTTSQIQDIYSGKIKNWKEVGGNNEPIRAFQRPQDSGSQTMLQKLMEGRELMTPPKEDVVQGMGGIIERTASYRNYKNAIGYSFLFFATEMVKNDQIKLLSIDGIKPDRETIRTREYPLTTEFYAVTAGSNNPNVEKFIEWILSSQGQALVEKTGYAPVK